MYRYTQCCTRHCAVYLYRLAGRFTYQLVEYTQHMTSYTCGNPNLAISNNMRVDIHEKKPAKPPHANFSLSVAFAGSWAQLGVIMCVSRCWNWTPATGRTWAAFQFVQSSLAGMHWQVNGRLALQHFELSKRHTVCGALMLICSFY